MADLLGMRKVNQSKTTEVDGKTKARWLFHNLELFPVTYL